MWRPSCGLELMPAARTDSGRLRGSRPLLTLSVIRKPISRGRRRLKLGFPYA